jgi:hypothetical protein
VSKITLSHSKATAPLLLVVVVDSGRLRLDLNNRRTGEHSGVVKLALDILAADENVALALDDSRDLGGDGVVCKDFCQHALSTIKQGA